MSVIDRAVQRIGRLFLPTRAWVDLPSVHHGTEYGGWHIVRDSLTADSIVYSLGVGEDISFDLAIIALYGVQVFAFDPTPRSLQWIAGQTTPPQFHMLPYGVADYDGTTRFFAPAEDAYISHTMLDAMAQSEHTIEVQVRRLSTLMQMCGHERIDLLKMDIEGAEYAVVDDLILSGLRPRQIVIEFHHRMLRGGSFRTARTVRRLRAAGYDLFALTTRGEEYSFWRRTP
jgi:FkbM family methyltransferase